MLEATLSAQPSREGAHNQGQSLRRRDKRVTRVRHPSPAMLCGEPWLPLRIASGHPRDEALADSPKKLPAEAAPSALPLVGAAQGQPTQGRAQEPGSDLCLGSPGQPAARSVGLG